MKTNLPPARPREDDGDGDGDGDDDDGESESANIERETKRGGRKRRGTGGKTTV